MVRRFENGSLSLDNTKTYFVLDESEDPISAHPYERLHEEMQSNAIIISRCILFLHERTESHMLVEEFMLTANKLVGRKIFMSFPNGMDETKLFNSTMNCVNS